MKAKTRLLLLVILCAFLVLIALVTGNADVIYETHASVTGFGICDDNHELIDPPQIRVGENIVICGNLSADAPTHLNFYLYRLPNEELVFSDTDSDRFSLGHFESRLEAISIEPGTYRVVVYSLRHVVAAEEFEVIP